MASNPLYLVKNRLGIFYVQIRNSRRFLGDRSGVNKFFRKSLRTRDLKVAIQKTRWYVFMNDDLKHRYWNSPEEFGKGQELLMRYESFSSESWECVEEKFLMGLEDDQGALLDKALKFRKLEKQANTVKNDRVIQNQITITASNNLRLSDLLNKYIDDSRSNWNKKSAIQTERSVIDAVRIFIEVNDNCLSLNLTKRHVVSYKECLFKLPKNRRKSAKYKNIPVDQFVSLDIPEENIISNTTKSNHITRVKGFLAWCARNDYVDVGLDAPLYRLFKKTKRECEERDAFTSSDIHSLFESKQYLNGDHKHPSHFWVPLLALLTGARQTELCQLYVEDVELDEGSSNWFIDINDDLDKKLKSVNSKRFVPIHDQLIDLGFLEYVQSRPKESKLFPECVSSNDSISISHGFQKWFNRTYLNSKNCNIQGKKSFHSFRHTVANYLKQHGFEEHRVSELLGHKGGSTITFSRYGKGADLQSKVELIEALQFEIDFDKMSCWKR